MTDAEMMEKYNKTLLEAKVEAEDIIAKVKELGLEWNQRFVSVLKGEYIHKWIGETQQK